ncbi:protein SHQ1 homolog [Xyrichtys novacula]|uniref:Protein SHQ1 homolog n=1 Tax=Xyrichtys novacula TaxID=13765 RepID=A0AAV1ER93_XYRNO|nr:protein SHQ1 homolog [Xyrichtys novacula]
MITPAFDLSQNPEYLIINIRVPYTRTSEFDLHADGSDFKFYAKPYFLRLSLPGSIVTDGRERATFDIDKGLFTVQLPKETPGENFEGLQMLTSLLAPKGARSANPLVEVLSADCSESAENDEDEEFEWYFKQEIYKESSEEKQKYGFGNQRSGVMARLQEELGNVIDIKNPEETSAVERRQRRLHAEACAFSPDHYLADLFEDDEIKRLLKYKPWWAKTSPSVDQEDENSISFTENEKEQLRKFNNRSYLLDKAASCQVWLSLVDILLAYSYDVRSTEGEHNVESHWTIRKLSGTLCWLETFNNLQEVLVSFGRRVLCYPLYRHFAMVSAAVRDTVKILKLGKACVLRCLLHIHKIFSENDPAYILNDLYITDYCIWIQRVKSKKMTALATMLQKASLQKKDLELELEELEEAATMVVDEEDHDDKGSCSSDTCSESADGSKDSEDNGQGCNQSNQAGSPSSKDNPLQPQSSWTDSPVPQDFTNPLPSACGSSKQLIQELETTVSVESKTPQDSSSKAEGDSSSSRTFLEISPSRNQLLIVPKHEDLDG